MKILVTGGAGFIGSHLVDRLLSLGETVVCLDDFNDYYEPALKRRNAEPHLNHRNYHLIEGDIRDRILLDAVFDRERFDCVVHLAARAGVRPSIREPILYQDVNIHGTVNLLESCRLCGVDRFIFGSSSSVYGVNSKVPFSEEDRVECPISPYAATKRAGELLCYTHHHLYGIRTTCLRFFTVYGPRQRPEMAIHKFARLIQEGSEVPFYGDGTSRRDYTYVDDILDGVLKAIEKPFDFEIFNLGESRTTELVRLVRLIEESLGKEALLDRLPDQPGDVPVTYADVSKARELLDYEPKVSVEEGIPRFVEWFLSRRTP